MSLGGANAADDSSTPATRGTVKVQPRFFNPFNVGISRLSIDPFGIFTLSEPAASAQMNPFAIGGGSAESSSSATTTTTVQAQDATISAPLTSTLLLSPQLVRPPFVPPDRSPFRPPPRPPFPP
jgi:hypothetical protein